MSPDPRATLARAADPACSCCGGSGIVSVAHRPGAVAVPRLCPCARASRLPAAGPAAPFNTPTKAP